MRLVIAGSRNFTDKKLMWEKLALIKTPITEVVCGCAKGADSLGEEWAKEKGIPVKRFPADWKKFGKKAGPLRNKDMAIYGDTAVVFIVNNSRGSGNMVKQMQDLNKKVWVIHV